VKRQIFPLFFFLILLSGCSSFSLPPSPANWQRQQQFAKALEQFSSSNRIELLEEIRDEDPDSDWGRWAETIVRYAQELDKRKEQLETLRSEHESLEGETAALREENQHLVEKIEQLKGLLIEQENRAQ